MNPLVNKPQMPDIKGMFNEFKQNPTEMLIKSKFNIPQEIGNNPQAIVQHLLNSGQISQNAVNTAQQRLSWLNNFLK